MPLDIHDRVGKKFKLGSRRYRVNRAGIRAVALVVELLARIEKKQTLFSLRPELRAIRHIECKAVLSYIALSASDDLERLIAIWLRGRCGGHVGMAVLESFANDRSERIRLAVARALRRMQSGSVLQRMADTDLSPRVRRLASSRIPSGFGVRLRHFSEWISIRRVPEQRGSLYVSPDFVPSKPIRLKSSAFIRHILLRIRALNARHPPSPPWKQDTQLS